MLSDQQGRDRRRATEATRTRHQQANRLTVPTTNREAVFVLQKIDESKRKWSRWWYDEVESKAGSKSSAVRESFRIIFVKSPVLGHMNGSVLIDREVLRLNVHRINQSSSRGELLQCSELVNLVPVVQHYIHDMRRFGVEWRPWEHVLQEGSK